MNADIPNTLRFIMTQTKGVLANIQFNIAAFVLSRVKDLKSVNRYFIYIVHFSNTNATLKASSTTVPVRKVENVVVAL